MGQSPRLIPPITLAIWNQSDKVDVIKIVEQIMINVAEAKDNLLLAKVFQADHSNRKQGSEDIYRIDDMVMLSTANRRKEYAQPGSGQSAKLFPRHDGPYWITEAFLQTSTYQIYIPNIPPNFCTTFHTSQLKRYVPNNPNLFPGHKLTKDRPVTLENRAEEHVIKRILDKQKRGRGWQYLVRWKGYGLGDDEWLPRRELEETIMLGEWLRDKDARQRG